MKSRPRRRAWPSASSARREGEAQLLAPDPDDAVPACLQFLHLGEAGLAAYAFLVLVSRMLAPPEERDN